MKKLILLFFGMLLMTGCTNLGYQVIDQTTKNVNVTNENLDVFILDHTTPTVILPLVNIIVSNNLSLDSSLGSYDVTVSDITDFAIGQHIRIVNSEQDRYYFGTILDINLNTITVDSPLDFDYVAGSEVTGSNANMNVDGSIDPVIFSLRTGNLSIPSEVDITRIIITCEAESAVDLNKFCDLPALSKGVVFRRTNSVVSNIFNIKSNGDLANIAYDFTVYDASNPAQGIDGFVSRLTFAGQNKIGVALRIESDGNLEAIVQDDLSGTVRYSIIAEGHIVPR